MPRRGRTEEVAPPPVLPSGGEEAYSHPADAQRQRQGKQKMPSKKRRLPVYLTQEEYDQIAASAARAGISLSKFAKLVCTGIPVPSLEHKQAVQDIIKARTDLGRLGGLLKQAIAADGDKFALQRLLREVDMGMRELKAAAMRIK